MVIGLWIHAERIATATDLAEFVGAALGIHSVFGLPRCVSGLITAAGQVVMRGFLHRKIPVLARRAVAMTAALIVLGIAVITVVFRYLWPEEEKSPSIVSH